jgi:hypothetical protein
MRVLATRAGNACLVPAWRRAHVRQEDPRIGRDFVEPPTSAERMMPGVRGEGHIFLLSLAYFFLQGFDAGRLSPYGSDSHSPQ